MLVSIFVLMDIIILIFHVNKDLRKYYEIHYEYDQRNVNIVEISCHEAGRLEPQQIFSGG